MKIIIAAALICITELLKAVFTPTLRHEHMFDVEMWNLQRTHLRRTLQWSRRHLVSSSIHRFGVCCCCFVSGRENNLKKPKKHVWTGSLSQQSAGLCAQNRSCYYIMCVYFKLNMELLEVTLSWFPQFFSYNLVFIFCWQTKLCNTSRTVCSLYKEASGC